MTIQTSAVSPWKTGSKVAACHLDRQAVVYVRQSTIQQVSRHQESTRLQYGLVDRAAALGWPRDRILVIDDDLGRSGASAEGRPGFQRLLAEVTLEHVGIILGVEMSRLARSCRDWHQLLEVCALFGTLIGDLDGLYDPTLYNDRLLLGLKGTMSEAELHVIKQRMSQGRKAKAARGELGMQLPVGYVRRPSGEVVQDPDEQARSVVALVFSSFERFGTLDAVLRHLVAQGVRMPVRARSGPAKGELEWHRPNRPTLANLLHNPAYAGAYVYGRRPTDPKRKRPGRSATGRTVAPAGQWEVCLRDRLPAYITWEQFERNLAQLKRNTTAAAGAARKGPSMLSGLVVCGRCGYRMAVHYRGDSGSLSYMCGRARSDYGGDICQFLRGDGLDALVTAMVLRSLEPAALEVSLQVAADVEAERGRAHQQWRLRLERAHIETERAFRQYNAVEPENRLVTRTLERQWEAALQAERQLREEYERFTTTTPAGLSEADRESIRKLASDIPGLWHAPTTTKQDRQAIVRMLVQRVVVAVRGHSELADVRIEWLGGDVTETVLARPVAELKHLSYFDDLVSRIRELQAQALTRPQIAERLNAEGWRPAKRRLTFNGTMVTDIMAQAGMTKVIKPRQSQVEAQAPDTWTLQQLARELDMPAITLFTWMRKGLLTARQVDSNRRARWLVHADQAELQRLRELRSKPRRWSKLERVDAAGESSHV